MKYVEFVKKVESTSWHQPNERLLHAAMGLCTEVGELFEVESEQHLIEEVGDVYWYLALAHDALGLDFERYEIEIDLDTWNPRGESPIESLSIYTTDLLDMVKKQVFYGRTIDLQKAELTLFTLKAVLKAALIMEDIDPKAVLQANINKLTTRYPEKFTEEAANNRDVKAEYAAMSR